MYDDKELIPMEHGENQTNLNVCQVEVESAHRVCLGGVDSLEAGEEQLVTRAVRLCVGAGQAEWKSAVFAYFSQNAKLFSHL